MQAESRQLVVKPAGILGGREVAIVPPPIGDGAGHPVDELPYREFPLPLAGAAIAASHIAVKVLAGHHVGGKLAPAAGNLTIGLLKDHPPLLVLDLRGAKVPVNLVERTLPLGAENPGNLHPRSFPPPVPGAI